MDSMQREELERLMFFEQTREKAAADYVRSPTDTDVCCPRTTFVYRCTCTIFLGVRDLWRIAFSFVECWRG